MNVPQNNYKQKKWKDHNIILIGFGKNYDQKSPRTLVDVEGIAYLC